MKRPRRNSVAVARPKGLGHDLPLTFTTKRESVVEYLRAEIVRGVLPAGTSLQQEDVARLLGLSPTPVREAFVVLEAEGLLESRRHKGVVVAQLDLSQLN